MKKFTILLTIIFAIALGCKKESEDVNSQEKEEIENKKLLNSTKNQEINVVQTNDGLDLFYLGNYRWRGGLAGVNIIFLGPTPEQVSAGILSEWTILEHDGGNTYFNWSGNGEGGFTFSIACAGYSETLYTVYYYSGGTISYSQIIFPNLGGACNLQVSGKIAIYNGKPVILDINSPLPPRTISPVE